MKNWQSSGIFAILILGFIFISGCTSPKSINTISQSTILPLPTVINSVGSSGWELYTCSDNQFSIYLPSDWTVKEYSVSQMMNSLNPNDASKIDQSVAMDKVVLISSPSGSGSISIYGVDYSNKQTKSIFNDPSRTRISNEFYENVVSQIKSSSTSDKAGTTQMKISSVEKDNNYYTINGNPARRLVLYSVLQSQGNQQSLSGDVYIIAHGDAIYIETYRANLGSSQSDSTLATGIMRTISTPT